MSTMLNTNYLLLYRTSADAPRWEKEKPSPQKMQEAYAQWKAWMEKFSKELIDTHKTIGGLNPTAKSAVYKAGTVTDGPYVEGKEVLAGFSFISADSLERALEIAKECPINREPGASVELRPLTFY
jgi:hypothetical protein